MIAALLHIETIGTTEDEIRYLNSERSSVEFLSDRYKARYGKYLMPNDESKLHTPGEIRSVILDRLEEVRRMTRKQASVLVIVAAVAAILAAALFDLGL
jgi:hypothetical protein